MARKAHEIRDDSQLKVEIALYGQSKASQVRNQEGLQTANERLLALVPRSYLVLVPRPDPKQTRQAVLGAIDYQRAALRHENQFALGQANEMILAAMRAHEEASSDKR